ncbi:MAG TPA: 16S rRNA (guanine(527)-N(7))-methyltransferase RsmG [Stellaceae bacterium]|nr:16S rRNA (guanine(527)-N(7))-methyltransferase RsmG [Stellaceae bacterium]
MRREPPLGPRGFAELFPVSRETLLRLEAYADLLTRWSARINLVGRDTLADLWRRHMLDSAQLQPLVPDHAQGLIDLGSGAGFPGMVLAILGVPGVELVEADARKAAFLREAARITEANATIRPCRIAAVAPHIVDVVTARALAPLDRLLDEARPFLGRSTICLFPKGERAAEELTLARKRWTMTVSMHGSIADPRGVVLRLHEIVCDPHER